MSRTHHLSDEKVHYKWDVGNEPLLEIDSGDTVVCPHGASEVSIIPPGRFGGNMDNRQLVRGSTLYLPIETEGALFSCGAAHGAQGDGEVCGTAVEAVA